MIEELKIKLMVMPLRDFIIIGFILFFLFGLSVGRIIGEYEEMIYINNIITYVSENSSRTLENDNGFYKVMSVNKPSLLNYSNISLCD